MYKIHCRRGREGEKGEEHPQRDREKAAEEVTVRAREREAGPVHLAQVVMTKAVLSALKAAGPVELPAHRHNNQVPLKSFVSGPKTKLHPPTPQQEWSGNVCHFQAFLS